MTPNTTAARGTQTHGDTWICTELGCRKTLALKNYLRSRAADEDQVQDTDENRCSRKRYAGSVAGCFLDGSRVASGWVGGVAGGQKWVAQAGWEQWCVGGGVREPNTTLLAHSILQY